MAGKVDKYNRAVRLFVVGLTMGTLARPALIKANPNAQGGQLTPVGIPAESVPGMQITTGVDGDGNRYREYTLGEKTVRHYEKGDSPKSIPGVPDVNVPLFPDRGCGRVGGMVQTDLAMGVNDFNIAPGVPHGFHSILDDFGSSKWLEVTTWIGNPNVVVQADFIWDPESQNFKIKADGVLTPTFGIDPQTIASIRAKFELPLFSLQANTQVVSPNGNYDFVAQVNFPKCKGVSYLPQTTSGRYFATPVRR